MSRSIAMIAGPGVAGGVPAARQGGAHRPAEGRPGPPHATGGRLVGEHFVRCRSTLVGHVGPALGVVGLLNVQAAIADGEVYVLEVNPRASRTIPFVSKAIGQPLAKIAATAGRALAQNLQ